MGEESCSVETNFGFLLFFCLLVFKDYRKEAFEIIGLESGCCEGKRKSAMNTSLVGELKSIETASLEECEQFVLTSLNLLLIGPSRVTELFLFLYWKGCHLFASQSIGTASPGKWWSRWKWHSVIQFCWQGGVQLKVGRDGLGGLF